LRYKTAALFAAILGVLGSTTATASAVEPSDPVSPLVEHDTRRPVQVLDATFDRDTLLARRARAFTCDFYTHVCVKFTKRETRAVAALAGPGLIGAVSWASLMCSKLRSGVGIVGCTALVSVYAYLLDRSFTSAASRGRCVELHFPYLFSGGAFWWKTEGC
jgi:hypothetical protein